MKNKFVRTRMINSKPFQMIKGKFVCTQKKLLNVRSFFCEIHGFVFSNLFKEQNK